MSPSHNFTFKAEVPSCLISLSAEITGMPSFCLASTDLSNPGLPTTNWMTWQIHHYIFYFSTYTHKDNGKYTKCWNNLKMASMTTHSNWINYLSQRCDKIPNKAKLWEKGCTLACGFRIEPTVAEIWHLETWGSWLFCINKQRARNALGHLTFSFL